MVHDLVFCIPRHEEYRDARIPRHEPRRQLSAAHAGHDNIGDQQIDAARVLAG